MKFSLPKHSILSDNFLANIFLFAKRQKYAQIFAQKYSHSKKLLHSPRTDLDSSSIAMQLTENLHLWQNLNENFLVAA